jgi:winged helix DNA-binding protein
MKKRDIAKLRLLNQRITGTEFSGSGEVVRHMGAIQAQDYPMALWAIGLRMQDSTSQIVEEAVNNGSIIRTHVLRPTWHFVAADDIRWMLKLTAPRIEKMTASACRQFELDAKTLNKCSKIIGKSLEGGRHLTRAELVTELERQGVKNGPLRAIHIMLQAEIDGVVCSGAKRGKQFTYALMDERVPQSKTMTKEESLAALALRYFTSHGPATLKDFVWWSGLTVANAKSGLESIKSNLINLVVDDQTYWLAEAIPWMKNSVHLLPSFDEFLVSYKDRSASLAADVSQRAILKNGIFAPVIVVNGVVTGFWKRSDKNGTFSAGWQIVRNQPKTRIRELQKVAGRFAMFMN